MTEAVVRSHGAKTFEFSSAPTVSRPSAFKPPPLRASTCCSVVLVPNAFSKMELNFVDGVYGAGQLLWFFQ